MTSRTNVTGMTIPGIVDRAASRGGKGDDPIQEAFVFPDERMTYPDFASRSRGVAQRLAALGVGPGDHVAYMMVNGPRIVSTMVGILRLGAVAVPINARYKGREIAHVVADADVAVLLVDDLYLDEALGALGDRSEFPGLRHVVGGSGEIPGLCSWAEFESDAGNVVDLDRVGASVDPNDLGLILYTSGTTARPKGVMHSQSSILGAAASVADRLELRGEERWWSPLPLFHIAAIAMVTASWVAGCTVVHGGFFDPAVAVRQLEDERCTMAYPAFETIWLAVLDHPDFDPRKLDSLRRVICLGTPERLRLMQNRLPTAVQFSATGSTESGGWLAIGTADDSLDDRVNTNGHVLPGMEVKLLDVSGSHELGPGHTGELLYRGPSRVMGYYGDPATTRERIDDDGWFHSGDIYRWNEDGQITFIERLKDMLKVGGENVAAAEIEDYLATHPSIRIVQVVAAPDARYVEVPCAYVQLVTGASLSIDEVIEYCRGEIATFKIPRYLRVVDEFPMSGTKIQKYKLRQRITAELAAAGITEAPRVTST